MTVMLQINAAYKSSANLRVINKKAAPARQTRHTIPTGVESETIN